MTMPSVDNSTKHLVVKELTRLWAPLEQAQIQALRDRMTIRKYRKNEIIYKDSELPDHLLCLVKGKVKIYKEGISRRPQILRVLKPIEFFAYRAYFAQEDYKTAGMAFEDTTIALIPMELVVTIMKGNYNLSLFFINKLSTALGYADERTLNLTQKHTRGRLAEALLFLEDIYGLDEEGILDIRLSREDLANLSNMTTSNAIRTLSAFANEHIISVDGRTICFLNEEELRRISELG